MPSRVLLLAPPDVDLEREQSLRTLTRLDGVTAATIPPGATSAGWWRAARSLRGRGYTVVHAWGLGALSAAAVAAGGSIVFSFDRPPTRGDFRWLRAIAAVRDVHVVCPTTTVHRGCLRRGFSPERCSVIRPGVPMGGLAKRDLDRRRALGIGDDERVLLLPHESTRAAGHRVAAWAMAILNVVDRRYRLLVTGRGDHVNELAAFCQSQRQRDRLIVADRILGPAVTLNDLLPLADAALVTPTGPIATLSIAVCMAAALPIVSTVTPEVAELLEDRHTALLTTAATPRAIAQRINELWADDRRRAAIADRARAEAFDYFTRARMMDEYSTLYERVATPGLGMTAAAV